MTASLSVFLTERAPAARAQWLQKLLEPVAAACKIKAPPPLEIRPTGCWGGWCADADSTPDGRVILSNKIVFWGPETIIGVYLHECTHRLLQNQTAKSHGPEFCCLLAILLKRAEAFYQTGAWSHLKIYDIADRPHGLKDDEYWHGTVLNWLLKTAAELADSDSTAEELALLVSARWQAYLVESQAGRDVAAKADASAVQQRKQHAKQVQSHKDSLMLWRCLSGLGWLFFVALTWFNLRGLR